MILSFRTKPDINGNIYRIEINTNKKEYTTNFIGGEIITTKAKIRELKERCKYDNYKEV